MCHYCLLDTFFLYGYFTLCIFPHPPLLLPFLSALAIQQILQQPASRISPIPLFLGATLSRSALGWISSRLFFFTLLKWPQVLPIVYLCCFLILALVLSIPLTNLSMFFSPLFSTLAIILNGMNDLSVNGSILFLLMCLVDSYVTHL